MLNVYGIFPVAVCPVGLNVSHETYWMGMCFQYYTYLQTSSKIFREAAMNTTVNHIANKMGHDLLLDYHE